MEIQQKKGLKRNIIDKYYTKEDSVSLFMTKIKQLIKINKNDLVIEPSAGNGAFIKEIKKIDCNYLFYDIQPEHEYINKQDYLELDINALKSKILNNKIHIIGNPPFGRQSSLAIKFIKKSCLFCDSISFILPKSFKKDSMKKAFPLNFHLLYEADLPENSFLVNNEAYDVPCVMQIWVKKTTLRTLPQKLEPLGFEFINKEANPDISFRRVGVNAGLISDEIIDKSIQSHYFIKFTNNKSISENMASLKEISYDFNNTVGPKSISKQELIEKFNELLI